MLLQTVLIIACKITSGTKSVNALILRSNVILQLKLQSLALSSLEIGLLLHGSDSLKAFRGEIQLFCRGLTDYEESKGMEVAKEMGFLTASLTMQERNEPCLPNKGLSGADRLIRRQRHSALVCWSAAVAAGVVKILKLYHSVAQISPSHLGTTVAPTARSQKAPPLRSAEALMLL